MAESILSYAQFLKDIKNFKSSGAKSNDGAARDFNLLDTPAQKYFKILFYFGSMSEYDTDDTTRLSGLLAPTWEVFNERENATFASSMSALQYYDFNSAWAYLMLNDELERAEKLEQFVTLLSDINTYSPWYFTSVNGIGEALERKATEDGKIDMNDRKKLTITCLPDAFDNRITTLLELYRDITWSWVQKKEIIPANLRKFDMALYIFEAPNNVWHYSDNNEVIIDGKSGYQPSYKMIEFHDCEFNYNSIKSGWNELNNQTGFAPTYNIEILYNDCYDVSYNEFMLQTIGDVIMTDTAFVTYNEEGIIQGENGIVSQIDNANESDKNALKNKLDTLVNVEGFKRGEDGYINNYGNLNKRHGIIDPSFNEKTKPIYQPGFISNAIGQVAGHLIADVSSKIKRAVLGNLYTYSLTQIGNQISDALQGNLIKAGMTVAQYIKNGQQRAAEKIKKKPSGNIFPEPKMNNQKPKGDLFPEPEMNNQKPKGDLFPEPKMNNQKPKGDLFPEPKMNNQKPKGDLFPEPEIQQPLGTPIRNIFN